MSALGLNGVGKEADSTSRQAAVVSQLAHRRSRLTLVLTVPAQTPLASNVPQLHDAISTARDLT